MSIAANYEAQLKEAIAFLQGYSSYLVVAHENPDGDAISSCAAMSWLLEQYGKSITIVNQSELPGRLSYLYHYDDIIQYQSDLELQFDAAIALDCADASRLGDVFALIQERNVPLLNLDHHASNHGFGTLNIIRPNAAATVEMVYDMIKLTPHTPNLECAKALYTGLLTDTGGFRYSNTSPSVMAMASDLLALGVSAYELADHLLEKMTMGKLKLLQTALSRITFHEDQTIGWVTIMKDDLANCGAVSEDIEGIVNYILNVEEVEVGILFKESDSGVIKASIRSKGKVNVSEVAQSFGGGGHVRAAGCRLTTNMEESVNSLVEAIRKALT